MHHISEAAQNITDTVLNRLISEKAAADYLGYSIRSLQKWRLHGNGPRYVRVSGRSIRYRLRELNMWAEARLCSSTSENLKI